MERKKAIKMLKELSDCSYIGSLTDEEHEALDMAIASLENERPSGEWVKDEITERNKRTYPYKCNQCGCYHRAMYDYCPSCGAKMGENT